MIGVRLPRALPDYDDDDDDDGGNYGAIAVAEEERKVWKIWPWQMIPPIGTPLDSDSD